MYLPDIRGSYHAIFQTEVYNLAGKFLVTRHGGDTIVGLYLRRHIDRCHRRDKKAVTLLNTPINVARRAQTLLATPMAFLGWRVPFVPQSSVGSKYDSVIIHTLEF